MEQKLQALLDKLYEEGVAKGQDVAAAVVKDAERKAEKILEEAEKEAAEIRKQAQEEAEEMKRNVISELHLAATQAVSVLKQKISHLITAGAIAEPLHQTFSDEEFLKKIIESLIENWHPAENGSPGVSLLLPPEKGEALYNYFSAKAKEMMDHGVQVNFDRNLDSGFRIGPADGSYVVSFTEKDFVAFFMDFLRPRTKELLYGND
jgi:V/A-type H+-transporting ATPase subunit E